MFPKKVSKNTEATSAEKRVVLMNNISLANGITSGLNTHLGEQQMDSSWALVHCKNQSNLLFILFVFKAHFNAILNCPLQILMETDDKCHQILDSNLPCKIIQHELQLEMTESLQQE